MQSKDTPEVMLCIGLDILIPYTLLSILTQKYNIIQV